MLHNLSPVFARGATETSTMIWTGAEETCNVYTLREAIVFALSVQVT